MVRGRGGQWARAYLGRCTGARNPGRGTFDQPWSGSPPVMLPVTVRPPPGVAVGVGVGVGHTPAGPQLVDRWRSVNIDHCYRRRGRSLGRPESLA